MSPSYAQPNIQLNEYLERLQDYVQIVPHKLMACPEQDLLRKTPGKWSRKELLGHLIDSALNNLKRFTDAQTDSEAYTLLTYQQDMLVTINQYQDLPLAHLITLWQALNQQILYVALATPTARLAKPVILPDGRQVTLSYIIEDYIAHMEHHFNTLL